MIAQNKYHKREKQKKNNKKKIELYQKKRV